MGIATAKFSEGFYFSINKECREKNDFYFNIFVNGNPQKRDDKEQKHPHIYILGLERLFKKDETFGMTMDHFAKAFNSKGDDNWNISYGDSPYGKCIIIDCLADNIKDNLSVAFQLSYRYEFTADFQDKEPFGITIHFDDFDSLYSDIDNRIEQNSIITAYEKPYIEEFEVLNFKGDKVNAIPDGEFGEISWSFGNVEKIFASLCDETGIEVANTPPYRVKIDKDRMFKLFVEKNGCTISQTLFIKAAYVIKNTDDWNAFATAVNKGDSYLDRLVILDADITVSQKIGDLNRGCFFSGTFDGNGHTITANIKDESKSGMSLFHIIQNATIKDLTVVGSITGGIHTAGLVGYSRGAVNKILNCIVEATINGGSHIGGILGHGMSSDIGINNCVFKGNLLGGSEATGVFVGWSDDGGAKSVTNCLYIMQKDQKTENLDLVKMLNGSVCVGNCYKTEDIGTYGTLAYLTEQPNFSTIEKTAIDGTKFYILGLPSGSGTEADPYAINNENDWNSFANLVSENDTNLVKTFEGEYVKLGADITVSEKIGDFDREKFFAGTFDGNGLTITANMEDPNTRAMAVFNYIKGATIKNLTVAGSITGGIDTAGLVGRSTGSGNMIEKCIVTATVKGEEYIGGILGLGKDSDIINNCVFKGLLNGGDRVDKGVFGGLSGDGTKTVTNCLYIMQENQEKQNLDLVQLYHGSVSFTNCYKTENIGTYGTQAYLEERSGDGFIEMTAVDGTKFYVQAFASGSGTEADPYIINNEQNWNIFANSVSFGGKTYEGEYIKLGEDITVSEKIGDMNSMKFFAGTFDGNGLTITANITDESNSGTALFQYIQSATIKNLTVAGKITGGMHAAGLVGRSTGSGNKISNCIVTAKINGGSHIGGILGHGRNSDITIDNCVFKGTFNGGSTAIGVFFGWGDEGGTKSVTNCLYIKQNDSTTPNIDLARMCDDCAVSVTDSYKTENIGTYGTLAYLEKRSGDGFIEMTAVDGTNFYVQAFASGSGTEADPYIINNEDNWNRFADSVLFFLGKTYEGEYVKLDADITISEKIGDFDREKFFAGTFDGNGHTVTAKMEDPNTRAMAVFSYIKEATIKNLTVAGSITGERHTAGVVGRSMGSGNKISNCIVTATIKGNPYIGGILGHGKDSDITIDNCVFKGKFLGGSDIIGVFVGYSDDGTKTVTNCLYIMQNEPNSKCLDLANKKIGNMSVTDCYKTENVGTYGTLAYLEKRSGDGFIEMTAVDGTKFYVQAFASGSGTKADPYIINNEQNWNIFANSVSFGGKTYEGEYVKLNKEISVSQKIGDMNSMKFFSGTFDGNGLTITADITDESNSGTALFQYIQSATIKNLTVAGKITGGMHAAGLVGRSTGSGNKISNCIVTAKINGGSHIGGILGHGRNSDITIDNCVFKGTFNGGSTAIGVFFGWGDEGGTKNVRNCLYIKLNDPKSQSYDIVNMDAGSVSVTDCYKTDDIGKYGTLVYLTKPSSDGYLEMTAVDGTKFYVQAFASGSGTKADPYIINNEDDWKSFANLVLKKGKNGEKSFEGEYIKLCADITVSEKIGDCDREKFFAGTFDGDGHTVTANINEPNTPYMAVFSSIKGATIKNLTVAGAITGGIHAASIVGCSLGSRSSRNNISNCIVTATIKGKEYIGGILGHGKDSETTIDNCVFKGKLLGGSEATGVFVGWSDDGTKIVTSSLYIKLNDPNSKCLDLANKNTGSMFVTCCYKTADIGKYGTLAYLAKHSGDGFIEMTAVDGTKFYVQIFTSGCGTETDPYIINNENDWNRFANSVLFGGLPYHTYKSDYNTYEGEYIKLCADITVSQKIGQVFNKLFAGTFDGDGHTITANLNEPHRDYMAVFSMMGIGTTIKNLTVTGTITGRMYSAGLVGLWIGGGEILNCIVTATINGHLRIGGILGEGQSDIVIDNCVFKGKLLGGSEATGVFVGWNDNGGTKSVTNCLYIMRNDPKTSNLDLATKCYDDCVVSVTNCYKTADIGRYGSLAYLTKPSSGNYIEKTAIDGTIYYVPT